MRIGLQRLLRTMPECPLQWAGLAAACNDNEARMSRALRWIRRPELAHVSQPRSQLLGCGQMVDGSIAFTAAGALMPMVLAP
ncbi:hypothetical protein XBLMG947_2225 [Xanthomonas bromi]|uniref:Uncharacterized protein n=1 Tax=Xanthomonas bromi TaxID=56449 RepID=A0A1C3NM10_9XANT|nr:hypothetical protein XBLMG947_2225 [Xanthomonas bromi]